MFHGCPKFTATSRQDYNRRCFGCLVPQPRTEVKREAGDSRSIHIDGHSGTAPRCCKPDDSGYMPLRDVVRTGRCRERTTASQKTGPKLWFGIPRGGVKPAVWFQGSFIFLAQATCIVADVFARPHSSPTGFSSIAACNRVRFFAVGLA